MRTFIRRGCVALVMGVLAMPALAQSTNGKVGVGNGNGNGNVKHESAPEIALAGAASLAALLIGGAVVVTSRRRKANRQA